MKDDIYFEIKIKSSRETILMNPFEKEFNSFDDCSYEFRIDVVAGESTSKIALMKGHVFDELVLEYYGMDILDKADEVGTQSTYDHILWLKQSDIYKTIEEDFELNGSWVGYIETCYVYPEFRNYGIASYLFNNIHKMLKHAYNSNLRCMCIYPQPQEAETWENIDDDEMLSKMKSIILKNGFVPVGTDNYYVKSYEFCG